MSTYGSGNPLVFTHLPKTAGTSLREGLVAALRPEAVFTGVDRSTFGSFTDFASMRAVDPAQVVHEPTDIPADVAFVSGHIAPSTTRARFPGADHLTVLRAARTRLLSTWLFSRAHTDLMLRRWGSYADWIRAARGSLSSYVDNPLIAPHTDNAMTRQLLWPHPALPDQGFIDPADDDALVEQALSVLDGFAHVGVVEDPAMLARIGGWLGVEVPRMRLNEARSLPAAARADVHAEADAAAELMWQRSRIDHRVWSAVVSRVLPDADPAAWEEQALVQALDRQASATARAPLSGLPRRLAEVAYGRVRAARR